MDTNSPKRDFINASVAELRPVREYLERIGAKAGGMFSAVIHEKGDRGYTRERVRIMFDRKEGSVTAPVEYAPTDVEAALIKQAIQGARLPEYQPTPGGIDLRKLDREAKPEDAFEFRDHEGRLLMVQIRKQLENGEKRYLIYTPWSDGKWRLAEPDGLLPLWGIPELRQASVVFLHEGAKAARRCAEIAAAYGSLFRKPEDEHPWAQDLAYATHIGWVGGAYAVNRVDWSVLKKAYIDRIFIVADNDDVGRQAAKEISRHLICQTFLLQFTDEFPVGFDLADPFPDRFFRIRADGVRHYVGPEFSERLKPATFATEVATPAQGKTKPVYRLRKAFAEQWVYVREQQVFVNKAVPWLRPVTADQLDANTRPYSDVAKVSELLLKAQSHPVDSLTYDPRTKNRILSDGYRTVVNMYHPGPIRPIAGVITPFLEFMENLIPDFDERREVERWIATLIAKPEVRIGYALILAGEVQGTGKSTLGTAILAPLIGRHNVSKPNATSLAKSEFNGWAVDKRLVIIEEIYEGENWAVYNKLKDVITEPTIRVNEKYMVPYEAPNWVHLYATSNSLKPLKVQKSDRRWLMPRVTETVWPPEKFTEFRLWLDAGGLAAIAYWASQYPDYVRPGEHAPMTESKRELAEESVDPKEKLAAAVAEMMNGAAQPFAITRSEVDAWLREQLKERNERGFASPQAVRKALERCGCKMLDKQLKVAGRSEAIFISSHSEWTEILAGSASNDAVRTRLTTVKDLVPF